MKKYLPSEFEQKWISQWEKQEIYKTNDTQREKDKQYVLVMFPYPSGAGLHVGHVRVYTGSDVIARYFRMVGKSVLFPMGWDAFGLPAENAAIKMKTNPKELVPQYIATFKRQIQTLGFSYDWNREFATTNPDYYKWTQHLFIEFYKMGLLYKKNTLVYFCDFCKTGLAEEEVLPDGTHERCGKQITRKDLPQWIFRITAYADRLLKELNGLDWPKGILEMQKNWIGKKEGINITYEIKKSEKENTIDTITCFTTRPDTNFGATFVVLAPEHEFVKKILKGEIKVDDAKKVEIKKYVETSIAKTDVERQLEGKKKTGVFTGFYALNKLNNRLMPLWISDFVLIDFGTGAVVGVPAHDLRDFEFAQTFGIEIIRVVVGPDEDSSPITKKEQVQEEYGTMINSEFLNGIGIKEATQKIMDYLEEKGWGKRVVTFHLRDWIFSRQRYWGEPIPMVYCAACAAKKISYWNGNEIPTSVGMTKEFQPEKIDQNISNNIETVKDSMYGWFPVDQKSLPLELPYLKSYEPTGTGESPLSQVSEWVAATCPNCGGVARRETDTMPNWAGSCWYFLRFADPHNNNAPWSKDAVKYWEPVDWYIGGAEHAVLHLLYSRFWVKALQDIKLLDFNEPFQRLRTVGIVLATDNRKMSKSFGNVINPDDVVSEFGADTLRVYEMFMAPFNQQIAWSTSALQGSYRFLKRIWELYYYEFGSDSAHGSIEAKENKELVAELNRTIAKITRDIPDFKFNTPIAAMMEFLNKWEQASTIHNQSAGKSKVTHPKSVLSKENAKKFLQILAPFAPFMVEELWHDIFGEKESIHLSKWPDVDQSVIHHANVNIPIQINGKMRGIITIPSGKTDEETVIREAEKNEKVRKYIEGKVYEPIYVKGKVLNFVIKS